MTNSRKVIWSKESSEKIQSIKKYLLKSWSEDEVQAFLRRVVAFEKFVIQFPKLYPSSPNHPKLRKAPITKHQSVIYEIDENIIRVHTILDHRQNL